MIGREFIFVKGTAKAALAVNTSIADNGYPSSHISLVDLEIKDIGSSSPEAMLSRGFAEVRDENTLEEAVVHCVATE